MSTKKSEQVFSAKLRIPSAEIALIDRFLCAQEEKDFQGEENTITHSVRFPDGTVMDIKCCGDSETASWVEAVLFQRNDMGMMEQAAYSDPSDAYVDTFELEDDNGVTYAVEVVSDSSIEEACVEPLCVPDGVRLSCEWMADPGADDE